jgi:tRNA(Arg) A34 adenosine deaminase TadA
MAGPLLTLTLPHWFDAALRGRPADLPSPEARMALVLDLARRNVEEGKGGPFAAAIFERDSGRLVSAGVNLVMPMNCCLLHAEVVAIIAAQRKLATFDLGSNGLPAMELVASTEPCVMCYGAVTWSGVRRLVCGARDEDARAIGFDEGAKPPRWADALRARGIDVVENVLRDEAAAILIRYRERGGFIYNARQGPAPVPPPLP